MVMSDTMTRVSGKVHTQPVEDPVAENGGVRSEAERLANARATAGSVQPGGNRLRKSFAGQEDGAEMRA